MTTYAVGEDTKDNSQTISLLQASLSPNSSVGGGDIKIVDGALSPEQDEIGPGGEPTSDQIAIYVVRQGDTLSAIAKMYGVSVNTIVWANDIEGGKISPGTQLVILPVNGIRHKVAKGETLASIAKDYHGDINEIVSFNDLSSKDATLTVGTEIIIPAGEAPKTVASSKTTGTSAKSTVAAAAGYFGKPVASYKKTQGIHGFNGVDLAAPLGTPILAAADGVVIVSKSGGGWNGGYGNYIVIKHNNGTQTLYAHLTSTLVAPGETVTKSQKIGTMGSTGRSSGSHLHFEVRGAKNPF